MFSRNTITTTLVVLSLFLFTSSTTNALAISNGTNSDGQAKNYTIEGDFVVLHTLVGDMKIAIPEDVKALRNQKNEGKQFERLVEFGSHRPDSNREADFFYCTEEAQLALSGHSESYRHWEAFFKRHSVSDTMAVRYCCNVLEFVDEIYSTMTPQCRGRARLEDEVLSHAGVRYTCRQYDFHSPECFLVRWMYWWIPILAVCLIVMVAILVCCLMRRRRSKEYSKTRQEEKKYRTSLVNGTVI